MVKIHAGRKAKHPQPAQEEARKADVVGKTIIVKPQNIDHITPQIQITVDGVNGSHPVNGVNGVNGISKDAKEALKQGEPMVAVSL